MFYRYFGSVFEKLHQRVHLSVKITVPFIIILFVSIGAIGWLFYSQSKETIVSLVEARLEAEAKSVKDKITLLQYAFASDPKQYGKRLIYELRQQEASMAQKGMNINQFIVLNGTFQPLAKITKSTIPFSHELAKQIEQKQNGIAHVETDGVAYTLAYAHSAEARYIYVLSIPDDQYLQPLHSTAQLILYAVIISLGVALVFGWFVVRSITSPFRVLIDVMKKVSGGDLTERSHLQKEGPELRWIAVSFNFMIEQMSQMIKEIKQMIQELNNGGEQMQASAIEARNTSTELSAHVGIVNRGVEQTAVSTETTTHAFQEMKRSIDQLFARIAQVVSSSEQMCSIAEDGQTQLDQVMLKMNEFATILLQLDRRMASLTNNSQSIGQVVDMITSIAKHTKLLALNATIEAARAGDAGKGFAVVAGEVAKLAGDSEQATVRIHSLITAIQNDIRSVSIDARQSTTQLADSQDRVHVTEAAFRNLRESIEQTNVEMINLQEGLSQISTGLLEVDRTIETFVAVSQETLSSTEQMMRASRQQLDSIEKSKELADNLISLSARLDQLSTKFKVS